MPPNLRFILSKGRVVHNVRSRPVRSRSVVFGNRVWLPRHTDAVCRTSLNRYVLSLRLSIRSCWSWIFKKPENLSFSDIQTKFFGGNNDSAMKIKGRKIDRRYLEKLRDTLWLYFALMFINKTFRLFCYGFTVSFVSFHIHKSRRKTISEIIIRIF